MKTFKNFLCEAINYEDMFKILWKQNYGEIESEAYRIMKDEIQWAKKFLKKQDRVVWYIIWIRLAIVELLIDAIDDVAQKKYLEGLHKSEFIRWKKFNNNGDEEEFKWNIHKFFTGSKINTKRIHDSFDHYFSMNIKEINNFVFVNYMSLPEIYVIFQNFENEWKEKQGRRIEYLNQPMQEDENLLSSSRDGYAFENFITPLIKFNDGLMWVDLNTVYCKDEEGRAMGHCGNAAYYDSNTHTILSLRKLNQIGKDKSKWFWEPFLTFILDENGFLGEMKGRGNDKPSAKYHKFILELLTHKKNGVYYIKGIKGGGYAPENNFKISDLNEQDQNILYELRPDLMPIYKMYEKLGKTDEVLDRIKQLWPFDNIIWNEAKTQGVIYKAKNLADFIADYGNDIAKWIMDVLDGSQILYVGFNDDGVRSVYELLDTKKVEQYLKDKYPEDEDSWEDDYLKFLKRENDDLYDELERGAQNAEEIGSTNEMLKYLDNSLKKFNIIYSQYYDEEVWIEDGAFLDIDHKWHEPLYIWAKFEDILKMCVKLENLDDDCDIKFMIETDKPYYGFYGFDTDAAKEAFDDIASKLL